MPLLVEFASYVFHGLRLAADLVVRNGRVYFLYRTIFPTVARLVKQHRFLLDPVCKGEGADWSADVWRVRVQMSAPGTNAK